VDIAGFLWAKKSKDEELWLSLPLHMADSAEVATFLWDNYLSKNVKKIISSGVFLDGAAICQDVAGRVFRFLACAHDIGKASPIFQIKTNFPPGQTDEILRAGLERSGLPLKSKYDGKKQAKHAIVSHMILQRHGFDKSVAVVLGGHHGVPPTTYELGSLEAGSYDPACGFDSEVWLKVQEDLLHMALNTADLTKDEAVGLKFSKAAQVILSGLVIFTDWIASDTNLFPLLPLNKSGADSERRLDSAYRELDLPEIWPLEQNWDDLYFRRFHIENPRAVQTELVNTAQDCLKPGIFVVEAPMGEGKTEAALAAAEILAYKAGARGIYFALPSQATSNAMFERVLDWIKEFESHGERFSAHLSHGKAHLNEVYSGILESSKILIENEDTDAIIAHQWFTGRKKSLFADFTIGTIDHLLMLSLKQKHLALRHLAFSSKIVIIDECHAYDTFMESFLLLALKWLGAYGVPVIILSATLPTGRREAVVAAYLGKKVEPLGENSAYPLIIYSDNGILQKPIEISATSKKQRVFFEAINDDNILPILDKALQDGGCAGVVFNTVKRAQNFYSLALSHFGDEDVSLLHSGFLGLDRAKKEGDLLKKLGKPAPENPARPHRSITIGTQIFEQSLDLDFDVLITDLCPMDLLLQRIGRMHRHDRNRPKPLKQATCYVIGADYANIEPGSTAVYGKYPLMKSIAALPKSARLPEDIPALVAAAYSDSEPNLPQEYLEDFENAKHEWEAEIKDLKSRSKSFQISTPLNKNRKNLVNWLDISVKDDDHAGEAAVRHSKGDSIEVLVVQKRGKSLFLLPWLDEGQEIPKTRPNDKLAKKIAGCSIRLPAIFGKKWMVVKTIESLEKSMQDEGIVDGWYKSKWLKGALCLILDENRQANLCGFTLHYCKNLGLQLTREAE
jgi:CRISPR-associated endonuclease/helicase Cas3